MSYNLSYEGMGALLASFCAEDGVTKGAVVTMSASDTVADCDSGDFICGVAVDPKEGFTAVQLAGLATVSYSGTAPAVGFASLVADGSGGVKVDATNGMSYLVISVDTATTTAVIRL